MTSWAHPFLDKEKQGMVCTYYNVITPERKTNSTSSLFSDPLIQTDKILEI